MPRRGRRRGRRPWSDEFVILFILRELFERRRQDMAACTVHQLSTLRGMPTQRDQRIRRLLENLTDQGLVSKVAVGQLTGYQLTEAGESWWLRNREVWRLFSSMRDDELSP